jgi:predicted RNase H-like nuclease (RuvC/YqgF family)
MPDWMMVLLGSLIAATPGVYAIVSSRQKVKAEAAQIVSDTAVKLLAPLQARIDRLEALIVRLETKVARLESENQELSRQVREFRELIRRLWLLVIANDIKADANLAAAVEKALGETKA